MNFMQIFIAYHHYDKSEFQTVSSATIILSPSYPCEYLIRLTNYDLLGREAFADLKLSTQSHSNFIKNINIFLFISPISSLIIITLFLKICHCFLCKAANKSNVSSKTIL